VRTAQRGDRAAYAALIQRHLPLLHAICCAHTLNAPAAANLADTAARAGWKMLWSASRRNFPQWLYVILREHEMAQNFWAGRPAPAADFLPELHTLSTRHREIVAIHAATQIAPAQAAAILHEKPRTARRAFLRLAYPDGATPACRITRSLPDLLGNPQNEPIQAFRVRECDPVYQHAAVAERGAASGPEHAAGRRHIVAGLSPPVEARLELHMLQCEECDQAWRAITSKLAGVRAALTETLPDDDFAARIAARLPEGIPAPPEIPRIVRVMAIGWLAALTGVLFAVILRILST